MNIHFFNMYGNGDVFLNMPYIHDIADQLKEEHNVVYCHQQSPRLTLNKNFKYEASPFKRETHTRAKVVSHNNNNYFNCHIAAYFDVFKDKSIFNTNLPSFHKMFTLIYQKVNQMYNTNLSIKNLEHYFYDIDYSFYRTQPIDNFFENTQFNRKILICNGSAISGQSRNYNGIMNDIIEPLASRFPNILFLCATKFNTNLNNINFCDDIIGHDLNNHNLNEVSYISSKCDIIFGRNSGQIVFCSTRKNMFDKSKKLIMFIDPGENSIAKNVSLDWNVSAHPVRNSHDVLQLLSNQI